MSSNTKNIPLIDPKLLWPFVLVTSLFALWGFANAVTDPMVQAFKKVLELSNSQAAWVQMAFYGGYFCMALPSAIFMRKYSYKKGILLGLSLYASGALLFYPAAQIQSFIFFCFGLYILTFGLAFLETAANPYILSMGPKETSAQRLNLSQSFNPVGLIVGLIVAQQFILKRLQSDDISDFQQLDLVAKNLIKTSDLLVIRNPYVILGLVVCGVIILFSIVKLPETKSSKNTIPIRNIVKILSKNQKYRIGLIAQVMYIGAQIMCWTYIYQYAESIGIGSVAAGGYQMVAFGLFVIGRAFGTYLLRFLRPGKLLMIFGFISVLFTFLTISIQGIYGLYSLVAISFSMSLMFPTIYSIALMDLSKEQAKLGSAGLVMAIVGGAIMPQLQGKIIDIGGVGVNDISFFGLSEINLSFTLPIICFAFITWYGRLSYRPNY